MNKLFRFTQVGRYRPGMDGNKQYHLRAMVLKGAAAFVIASATLAAQQAGSDQTDASQEQGGGLRGIPVTLAGQFFDHDFVNYTLFGNGVFDTNIATLQGNNVTNSNGFGWSAGGGVTASHTTRRSVLSLNYRGSYRRYGTAGYGNGTDQNLAVTYGLRLSRRWFMSLDAGAGIIFYGGGFYSIVPNAANTIITNPLSSQSRFLSTGANFTYQFTRRLSFVFGGSFFLNNYNYGGAFNSRGGSGQVSALYRTSARTTVGATYSHSYYTYSGSVGQSTLDGVSLTLSHFFPNHWQASITVGANRTHSSGVITVPVSIILGQQTVTGYVVGPYDRVSFVPSFQGSITHYERRQAVSISAGQGVVPGNGTFLTSRNVNINGIYSYSLQRSNFSLGGAYFRMSSIANNVSQDYGTTNFSASYSYVLTRHLSANFRYDLIRYGGLFNYGDFVEHRLTFGIALTSKSIPLTLF